MVEGGKSHKKAHKSAGHKTLGQKTVEQLRKMAKRAGVKQSHNGHTLKKSQLVAKLRKA